MNNEFRLPIGSEIRIHYAVLVFGDEWLPFIGILFRVQDKLRVDNVARQREDIERPVNQMVPVPGDVQAADLAVAAGLVLNWRRETFGHKSDTRGTGSRYLIGIFLGNRIECQAAQFIRPS